MQLLILIIYNNNINLVLMALLILLMLPMFELLVVLDQLEEAQINLYVSTDLH